MFCPLCRRPTPDHALQFVATMAGGNVTVVVNALKSSRLLPKRSANVAPIHATDVGLQPNAQRQEASFSVARARTDFVL